jgi:hypothetical protein
MDNEDQFDELIERYKLTTEFRLNHSGDILSHFEKDDKSFGLTLSEKSEKKFKLSSTAICNRALNQYKSLWSESEKYYCIEETNEKCIKNKNKNKIILDKYEERIKKLYGAIFQEFLSRTNSTQFEPPDEFTTLSLLSSVEPKQIEANIKTVAAKVVIALCKAFLDNKFIYSTELPHPYIYYKLSLIVENWYEEIGETIEHEYTKLLENNLQFSKCETFEKYLLENVYIDAKYELYRQLALYSADDKSKFDVKRLIYSLLIISQTAHPAASCGACSRRL